MKLTTSVIGQLITKMDEDDFKLKKKKKQQQKMIKSQHSSSLEDDKASDAWRT